MDLNDLPKVKLPRVMYKSLPLKDGSRVDLNIENEFFYDDEDGTWYVVCRCDYGGRTLTGRTVLDNNILEDLKSGVVSIDEYCQSERFNAVIVGLSEIILGAVDDLDVKHLTTKEVRDARTIEAYTPQAIAQKSRSVGRDIARIILESAFGKGKRLSKVPKEYRITPPKAIVPDDVIVSTVLRYIAEGSPAVALVGPTGVGKSYTAQHIGALLNLKGYAVMRIDANARTEGDRLFDRDDFNEKGTFILEGTLTTFARRTKKLGLKALVIIEEYNAFDDATRREFYQLFNDEERYYTIQSSKDQKVLDRVDFHHVQFLLTGNPVTSEKYLVDDLKRFSNAEARRIVMVYQDYSQDPRYIRRVLMAIIRKKPIYEEIKKEVADIDEIIDLNMGVRCFRELNRPNGDGYRLGFDFGYTSVANWLWTLAVYGYTEEAWIRATADHILNPIPDVQVREDVVHRLESVFGVHLPGYLIYRDS